MNRIVQSEIQIQCDQKSKMIGFNGLLSQVFFIIGINSIFAKATSEKIKIMYSHQAPFVIKSDLDGSLKGLDISIMENFAKKMNLHIEYIQSNESLHSVFNSDKKFENFMENHSFE